MVVVVKMACMHPKWPRVHNFNALEIAYTYRIKLQIQQRTGIIQEFRHNMIDPVFHNLSMASYLIYILYNISILFSIDI